MPVIVKRSHTDSQWVEDAWFWFWGQRVKSHNAVITENGVCMVHNYFPFTPITMKLHTQTSHDDESTMCPIDFRVLRSQWIDNWKWFLDHNCFPLKPIMIKLYTQTLYKWRMCTIDFRVQRSRSQCIDTCNWFMVHNFRLGQPIVLVCNSSQRSLLPSFRVRFESTVNESLENWFWTNQFIAYELVTLEKGQL